MLDRPPLSSQPRTAGGGAGPPARLDAPAGDRLRARAGIARWLGLPLVLVLALLAGAAIPGDAPERGRELMRLVPRLDRAMALHLLRDDDGAFRRFCRDVGISKPKDALASLYSGIATDSPEAYERTGHVLFPHIDRITGVLDAEFDCPEYARLFAFRESLGPRGLEYKRLLVELEQVQQDGVMKLARKVERYRDLAAKLERLGDGREAMTIEGALARDVMQDGLLDVRIRLLRSALARARRLGEHVMICQLLGELGHAFGVAGDPARMLDCYREGIECADHYDFRDQSARLRLFLVGRYFALGRLAVSASLLQEAKDACRELRGNPLEIRVAMAAMLCYSELGCWEMVHHELDRLPALQRSLDRTEYTEDARRYALRARYWRARWLGATGRTGEAADTLGALCAAARSSDGREVLRPLLQDRPTLLLQAGRAREALAAAEQGIAYADSFHLDDLRQGLAVPRVQAALAMGALGKADSALDDARRWLSAGPEKPVLTDCIADGLGARIALARGRPEDARRLLGRGLSRMRTELATMDRGPRSDLALQEADDLSTAAQEMYANSPGRSMAFELYWRSLASWVGGAAPAARAADARRVANAFGPPARTLRLVYAEAPEGLVRWSADRNGVRREVIATSMPECAQLVRRVVDLASTDPGDAEAPMPEELRQLSARLGRLLLPAGVRAGDYDRVEVATEGVLGRLPFELLGIGPADEYEPLLARCDVAYTRPERIRLRRLPDGPNLILADAHLPGRDLGPREPLAPLNAIEMELDLVRARLPRMQVVRSTAISKPALLRAWSHAGLIYVAAHLVRDPDAPLLSHFPIPFETASRALEDHYLDIRDVRDTDLDPCRLVVLSSCASGEPYVVGTHSGPSMADAFLDAGAAAVIHTRWRVRDASAAETAPALAAAWLDGEARHSASEWRVARLQLMRGPRGLRHPFEWAAWSVSLAQSVPAWETSNAFLSWREGPGAPARRAATTASPGHVESPR